VKTTLILSLILAVPVASTAFEKTILYDRKAPPLVTARPHRQVRLKFEQPVLSLDSTIPADQLKLQLDEDIATMAVLTGFDEALDGMIYVTLTTEEVYTFWVKGRGKAFALIHVKDERELLRAAVVQQESEQSLTPDEQHFRELMYAMWGYRSSRVTMQKLDQLVKQNSLERVTILRRYDGQGYYGFTQLVEAIGPQAIEIHPAQVKSSRGLLFAVAIDGHKPALREGQSPYLLRPGMSALMHTVYQRKGGIRAQVP
jgi:hypothetical protein